MNSHLFLVGLVGLFLILILVFVKNIFRARSNGKNGLAMTLSVLTVLIVVWAVFLVHLLW